MSKRDYDSYMDSIEYGEGRHQRLMDVLEHGKAPDLRGQRAVYALIGAAACLALICAASWGVLRGTQPGGSTSPMAAADTPTPGADKTPAPDPSVPPAVTPAPTAAPDGSYVLSPADPFDGQAHSSPAILGVEFDPTAKDIGAVLARPAGYFEKQLSREEMVYLLGGEDADDAPWMLDWVGYDVTGTAAYDGYGKLWLVTLSGQDRANEHNMFTLRLAPGALPPSCTVDPNQTATELHGVTVYGSQSGMYGWTDENGTFSSCPVYQITMLNGNVGLRYTVFNADGDASVHLATQAANQFALTAPTLDALLVYDGAIPEWHSGEVTLEQATKGPYGAHVYNLIETVPGDFTFEKGHWELGQDRNRLSLSWTGEYGSISVTFFGSYDPSVQPDKGYAESLRSTPYPVDVADAEILRGMEEPVIRREDLTLEAVQGLVTYQGELEDWQSRPADVDRMDYRGSFAVLYPDGVLGRFSFKGVRPEEALAMAEGTNEPCVLPVPAFTVTGAAGSTANLSAEDTEWLCNLLNNGQWQEGTSDCLCEYSLSIPMAELYYNYHAQCGTFNDTKNQRNLTLSDADREAVNAMLSDILAAINTISDYCNAPCTVEGCTEVGFHSHNGVYYQGSGHHAEEHHSGGEEVSTEFTVIGREETAALSAEDAEWLADLLDNGQWQEGTFDCDSFDYSISCPAKGYGCITYHTDCGTIQAIVQSQGDSSELSSAFVAQSDDGSIWVWGGVYSMKSIKLADADRKKLNDILDSLGLEGRTVLFACEPCPVEDCTEAEIHTHNGVYYYGRTVLARGFVPCPKEDCTETGTHTHDGVYYCGRTACAVEGCTEAGFHSHSGVCFQGCGGVGYDAEVVELLNDMLQEGLQTNYKGDGHHAEEHHSGDHH